MRLAFFGDVIGKPGRDALSTHLPGLKRRLALDFVCINAENAAAGFGITENTARELFQSGADCLTLGNHAWDQREALTYIVRESRLIRPLNYPILSDAPGRGAQLFETDSGKRILVIGDGQSDMCVAGTADFVFAKGRLAEHCERNNLPYARFDSFAELPARLALLPNDVAANAGNYSIDLEQQELFHHV